MRRLIPAIACVVLCMGASSPVFAQAEAARALADIVHEFNRQTAEARAELARTGDHAAYKAKIDPLLNNLKATMPGAINPGRDATDAIIRGMEDSRKRKEQE